MLEQEKNILEYAKSLASASGIEVAVFDFSSRGFWQESSHSFCPGCSYHMAGSCQYSTAHQYGCFEAERWSGQYIYYCPASLVFIATIVYEEAGSGYALVAGPVVMGNAEDVLFNTQGIMREEIHRLPGREPEQVNDFARVQRAVAAYLSAGISRAGRYEAEQQASLLNTLYELSLQQDAAPKFQQLLKLEKRLQDMIISGDKQGARELINQLLGAMYFDSGADLLRIKHQSKELIVLFSRASVEGGADANQIFGSYGDYMAAIDGCRSLEELSSILTSTFNRFVSYVFDFERFKHADILHKVVEYVRRNYSAKITLEEIAGHVGLSRSYLSTIISEEMGQSFTDFVNSVRVEKSKELLGIQELSLAEIAAMIGYNDQSYYTKVFTRIVGMSPGQYRKSRKAVADRL